MNWTKKIKRSRPRNPRDPEPGMLFISIYISTLENRLPMYLQQWRCRKLYSHQLSLKRKGAERFAAVLQMNRTEAGRGTLRGWGHGGSRDQGLVGRENFLVERQLSGLYYYNNNHHPVFSTQSLIGWYWPHDQVIITIACAHLDSFINILT